MLIPRYLLKEIAQTFGGVILVILLIAISNKFVRLVGKAAIGDVAPEVLFQVFMFQIPEILAFLLPIALFLAILLSYSRFFADNEIQVMLACGISWQRMLMVGVGVGLVVMLIAGSMTCYLNPHLAQHRERLLHQEGPLLVVQTLAPGRFHTFERDSLVLYVGELSGDRKKLKRIFIAEDPKGDPSSDNRWSVLTASAGEILKDEDKGYTFVKLTQGRRYDGMPGAGDYSVVTFDGFKHLLETSELPVGTYFHRTMPTQFLLKEPSPGNNAELQWRLAIPLSAPLLAILALPLSQVSPRAGRFGRLFLAVMICILYYNLLTLSKRWVAKGIIASPIGLWWVHGLLLILGLVLLAKSSGRSAQLCSWFKHRISHENR